MADKWLNYTIHLSDKPEVELQTVGMTRINLPRNRADGTLHRYTETASNIAKYGYGMVMAAPERLSREYANAPLVYVGDARPTNAPFITSPWIFPTGHPDKVPTNKDTFEKGNWFTNVFGFGHTYKWLGRYEYTPSTIPIEGPGGSGGPSVPLPITQRRWIDGFEVPDFGEGPVGNSSAVGEFVTRDASRHPDGLGLRICESTAGLKKIHTTNEFRAGLAPTDSWERFYVRVWNLPTAAFQFWMANTSGGGFNGVALQLLPSGNIACCDVTGAGVSNILATSAQVLTLGQWYRLDLIFQSGSYAGLGTAGALFDLWIDRIKQFTVGGFPVAGWGVAGYHTQSALGAAGFMNGLGVAMDFDDWIGGDRIGTEANAPSLDWQNGSRVVLISPTVYGPLHTPVVWGADHDATELAQRPATDADLGRAHVSTTAGVTLEVETDVARAVGADPKAIGGGIVALVAGLHQAVNAGGGVGTIGMARNGGAYVDEAQPAVSLTPNWDSIAYLPTGLTEPQALTSLRLKYVTGSGAFTKTVKSFVAVAEVLGLYSAGDQPPLSASGVQLPPPHPSVGPHNSPYERSPWAYNSGTPPISPVIIHSGTYEGNGTVTVLKFRAPVTFLYARRVTGSPPLNGTTWWSSMLTGLRGHEQPYSPEQMTRAFWAMKDPPPGPTDYQDAECEIQITGTNLNAAGVTYHYVTYQDPGMRFSLNAAAHANRGSGNRQTLFFKPTFLPEFGLFHRVTRAGSTAVATYMKGRGHSSANLNKLDAAEGAGVSWAAGWIATATGFLPAAGASGDQEFPFSLWRRDDGSADPGIPNALQILTWVGDGGASRTVSFAGTSKRPLWAMVGGHTGTTIVRDAQHTGTTSSLISTGEGFALNAATGITAGGPGTITVGSLLNVNAVIYEAFILIGGDTACNNGWGCDGEYEPVDPIEPPDWPCEGVCVPTDDDPPDDDPPDDDPPGDGDPPGEPFGAQCVVASQKLCNQALSHIGISEPLVDIVLDVTPEAHLCRLHFVDAINEALREFPWDFATKYATLVRVAGDETTPVNEDWIYSYRVPADLLFPRRLVRPGVGRAFDPYPPTFRMGGPDATGRILFSNYRDPDTDDGVLSTVQLEYTYAPNCVASVADALFRQALGWLMASKLAPALSRNKVTSADCWSMFVHTVDRARTINARAKQQGPHDGDAPWITERE